MRRTEGRQDREGQLRVGGVEFVGLCAAVVSMVWSVVAALRLAPTFQIMLADVGGSLAPLTQLCLRPWFLLGLGLTPLALVGEGIARNASPTGRAIRTAVAVVVTLAQPAVFLSSVYLPIVALTEVLKE
jgi:hypothetical protein